MYNNVVLHSYSGFPNFRTPRLNTVSGIADKINNKTKKKQKCGRIVYLFCGIKWNTFLHLYFSIITIYFMLAFIMRFPPVCVSVIPVLHIFSCILNHFKTCTFVLYYYALNVELQQFFYHLFRFVVFVVCSTLGNRIDPFDGELLST